MRKKKYYTGHDCIPNKDRPKTISILRDEGEWFLLIPDGSITGYEWIPIKYCPFCPLELVPREEWEDGTIG